MDEIISAIKGKKTFKEVDTKEFAPSGKWAERIAGKMEMKTTQLRKIFTMIKNIEQNARGRGKEEKLNDPNLYMLIPHLAYAKARKLIDSGFYDLMKAIIGDGQNGKIDTVEDFRHFVQFMTAIVAYNKK